jgi:hypothetical protein
MRKLLVLITILFTVTTGMAQSRHTITATVIDSAGHTPLEFVTVAVLQVKDSSLVSYTRTDKNGLFTLYNIKDAEPLRLLVSYVGYQSLRIRLKFPATGILNLGRLQLNAKNLTEVTIKGEVVPILIKKDTIEFNAEAFKVRPNALVQDLLKKLPGMQVDRDGTLSFNGQHISKVKVDGRDFFANNYKIATQNLDADMISKVQVYDDRENDPDHLQPDYQVKKIINLKFKKEFTKSTFGKLAVGGGTQDRYQLDGTFIKSINDLEMAVVANSNNLNGTNFISPAFSGMIGPRQGLQQITTTAVNINDNFGKFVKMNLTYNLNDQTNNNTTVKNVQRFLHDTTITTNSSNLSHGWNLSHALAATVEYTPDNDNKWKFNPQLTYNTNTGNSSSLSTSFNNFTPLLNTDNHTGASSGSNTQYQHLLSYYHAFKKKGESLTITNNVSFNPSKNLDYSLDNLVSYVVGLNSDTLNRFANSTSKNSNVSVDAAYHYPLGKNTTGVLDLTGLYTQSGAALFTYNQDPKTGLYDIYLTDQSTNLTRNLWGQSLHPEFIYQKDAFNFHLGGILLNQQINNEFGNNTADLNQNYAYLLPALSLGVGKFNFSYNENVNQPNIGDMQPITMVSSPLFSFTGNPNLKPVRSHVFNARYFSFNQQSGVFSSINLQYSQENNSITRQSTITAQGATISMPINGLGRTSGSLNYSINKRFKKDGKWEISTNSNFFAGFGRNYYFVNSQPGYQDTYYGSFNQQVSIDWNDMVSIDPGYRITPNITRYELVKQPEQSYAKQQVSIPVNVKWPKRIILDINYDYIYNPLVAPGFQRKSNLFSISVARLLQQKDKGEFRLTCYDLFNQSVSSYHYAESNSIVDNQYQTLKRYFMLSYSYRFNKITTKEKR